MYKYHKLHFVNRPGDIVLVPYKVDLSSTGQTVNINKRHTSMTRVARPITVDLHVS